MYASAHWAVFSFSVLTIYEQLVQVQLPYWPLFVDPMGVHGEGLEVAGTLQKYVKILYLNHFFNLVWLDFLYCKKFIQLKTQINWDWGVVVLETLAPMLITVMWNGSLMLLTFVIRWLIILGQNSNLPRASSWLWWAAVAQEEERVVHQSRPLALLVLVVKVSF